MDNTGDVYLEALAVAVIERALTDLGDRKEEIRADAQAFLSRPEDLGFWCELAGIDMTVVPRG
jgi:hypothetical protein